MDMLESVVSRKTIADWKQPFIGGIVCEHLVKYDWRAARSVMSISGQSTLTPRDVSSDTISSPLLFPDRPDRVIRIRFIAPLLQSQRAMLRPMPPRPPVTTYVAFGLKRNVELFDITVCSTKLVNSR
jgi:hypothetical protein